jgi:phosphoadenosine phosphosulfate reductase
VSRTDFALIRHSARLEGLSPQQMLCWAVEAFSPNLVMTSAFGLNGVALIHMLQEVTSGVPIVFVDTGYLFDETLETKRRIEVAYGVRVLTFRPSTSTTVQVRQIGPDLSTHWPNLCCTLRKAEPLLRANAALKPAAVLNGRARFQSITRRNLPSVEWSETPVRINPLASWSHQQIKDYVRAHNVPYNPLHDQGYPSVGCWPCTRPVTDGEEVRAGRWAGLGKVECGLWTQSMDGSPAKS